MAESIKIETSMKDLDNDTVKKACALCLKGAAKYTCPRCNVQYCSVDCYRSEKHRGCSENFYKDCFMEGLKECDTDPEEKQKVMEMLQRVEGAPDLDDGDSSEDDLEERLGDLDLNEDVDKVWDRLTDKEKQEFKSMTTDGRLGNLVDLWVPWWETHLPMVTEVKRLPEKPSDQSDRSSTKLEKSSKKLERISEKSSKKSVSFEKSEVSPERSDEEVQMSSGSNCPKILAQIPQMFDLIKTKPSADMKCNVVNVLYGYAYVSRLHNGDHVTMATESAEDILEISEVMGQGHTCGSVEEAIQMCFRNLTDPKSSFESTTDWNLKIIKDVEKLMINENKADPLHFPMAALSDVHQIFKNAHKIVQKQVKSDSLKTKKEELVKEKSKLFHCVKKCEFLLSWCQTYGMALCGLVTEVDLVYSLLATEFEALNQSKKKLETQWGGMVKPRRKKLVEEL
ncbi:ZNHI2-like protein [Mya arenaria]|uniref:ZNHI2-like protein n=1 Tax=Mya arenaria TaxID=6604 RepID=A0ABY7EZ66_MYAAR|nr:zinc finger HIT domain-containing protein 2-like [Mya arenaria]WAR15215.1 ZNHI2-like protein [Mya arenaria]